MTTTKHKMLPMVQECCRNLQEKAFNNHALVVHFLPCRAEAKEISLLIFTNRVLLWTPQRSGYHFRSKWVPLNLHKWKAHCFALIGNRRQCKIQHCFCSQNIRRVVSTRQYLYLLHVRTWLKYFEIMSQNVKIAFNYLFYFRK